MRKILCFLLLSCSLAAAQNFLTVAGSNTYGYGNALLPSGSLIFTATDSHGAPISYQAGGGGQVVRYPTACSIANGVIASGCQVANVSVSNPANFCYSVQIVDAANRLVLGGPQSGYNCVQPQTTNFWCASGTCNFDQYVPNIPTALTMLLPLPKALSIGGVYAFTCPVGLVANGVLTTGLLSCVTGGGGGGLTFPILAPNGGINAPSYTFQNNRDLGWSLDTTNTSVYFQFGESDAMGCGTAFLGGVGGGPLDCGIQLEAAQNFFFTSTSYSVPLLSISSAGVTVGANAPLNVNGGESVPNGSTLTIQPGGSLVCASGSTCPAPGVTAFAALTPGVNATPTPFGIAPSSALGGSTPDFSVLGAVGDANTGPVVNIDTPTGSQQNSFRAGVNGVSQLQTCWQPGPLGEMVFGSTVACPSIYTTVFAKNVFQDGATGHTGARFWQSSGAYVGDFLQFNTATAAGTGFNALTLYTGVTGSDTYHAGGVLVAQLDGNGDFLGSSFGGVNPSAPIQILTSVPGGTACVPTGGKSQIAIGSDGNFYSSNNGGACVRLGTAVDVINGTASMPVTGISAGTCSTVTVSAPGVLSTDSINWTPNASIKAVNGYSPPAALAIQSYPTANFVNFDVCNNAPTGSVTPGAVTLNWRVAR
jgi:hypothetical protein